MCDDFFSDRFYNTFGPHTPSLRVDSGTTLRIICPDSDGGLADGTVLPPERRQAPDGADIFDGNPLAGPIHIQGLTTADCLAVTIHAVELDREAGATLMAPAHGFLPQDLVLGSSAASGESVPRHLYRWRIDRASNKAKLVNPLGDQPLSVPLRPMIGCVGVCPDWGQSICSLFAGSFGGNLDLPIIEQGATIFLPVYRDGGLLFVGDIHAAQGAGEIIGGGIETSGVATLTVRRLQGRVLAAPRLIAKGAMFSLATDGDLRTAVCVAFSRLLDWLAIDLSLARWDAYQLMSQCAILEIGCLSVRNSLTVAAGLSIDRLPPRCREELEIWLESAGQ